LELTAPTIKILSWNVYKGREAQFLTDFASLSSDKDIVMLSEVTDGPEVKPAFDRSLQFGWDFGISFYMKGDIMTGLATGSVAQPKSILVKRTQHKEPFVGSYKLILITTYHHRPTGLDIMALNIHGINQVPDREFEQQIADVAPVIAAHRGPVVFVGDFNVNSDQRMPMLKRILEPLGLRRLPWENPKTGKQLDDGFARGFEVRRARFLNQVINRSSDHPAMELELLPVAQ
jgi:endonuclease/exonuclease/phosphatase (EEP) superfamily protein YafD